MDYYKNYHKQLATLSDKLNRDRKSAIEEVDRSRKKTVQLQKQYIIDDLY